MPDNQGLYSKQVIADLFNLSERRIEQLAQKKIIPKAGRGVFDLGPTVQAYVRYLQGLCSGAIHEGESSELDRRLMEARVLERESKARQAKCKADLLEQSLHVREISTLPERLSQRLSESIFDRAFVELAEHEARQIVNEILNGGDTS